MEPLRAFEHQAIEIGPEPTARTLGFAEAELLDQLAERRPGFCIRGHNRLKLAQYCGVINLGSRTLEVLPKVDTDEVSTSRTLLLRMLRVAHGLEIEVHGQADAQLERTALLDVFVRCFLDEVASLVHAGLLREYRVIDENLGVVRGRIAVSRQVTVNAGRPDRVWCEYDDLTTDCLANGLLALALVRVKSWIMEPRTLRLHLELTHAFDGIQPAEPKDLRRFRVNRRTARYRRALAWVAWILGLISPTPRAGDSEAPSILFDMNDLFEKFVARLIMQRAPVGYRVDEQPSGVYLADAHGKPAYQLIPDLLVTDTGRGIAVADTKWKRLTPDEYGRVQPGRDDMYQMNAYATGYDSSEEFALIYPHHDGMSGQLGLTKSQYRLARGERVVHVMGIDLTSEDPRIASGSCGPILSTTLASAARAAA